MAVLSKSCIYGVQAAIYIAALPKNEYVSIQHVAAELNISFHFLTKVLQTLTQKGLMVSYRGPNGGIALAQPATAITLADVISAIDGAGIFTDCILSLPDCSHAQPCPLHEQWSQMRGDLSTMCASLTLNVLAERYNNPAVRLAHPFDLVRKDLLRSNNRRNSDAAVTAKNGDHVVDTRRNKLTKVAKEVKAVKIVKNGNGKALASATSSTGAAGVASAMN
jgi:Rrf2 family transcriptional regulator, iron-sulfur cluster assembly transcription factor